MLAAAVLAAAAASCRGEPFPASDDMRRLAAEIIVMRGDAERIAGGGSLSDREGQALSARLYGALASLPMLLRRASGNRHGATIAGLRTAFDEADWRRAISVLKKLGGEFPFDDTGLILAENTPETVKLGGNIHEAYCAACHDGGDPEQWLPIPDLFEMARTLPDNDLAARFFNGIRGDRSTALAQPMSAGDIAALIAFYRQTTTLEQ